MEASHAGRLAKALAAFVFGSVTAAGQACAEDYYLGRAGAPVVNTAPAQNKNIQTNSAKARDYAKPDEQKGGIIILEEDKSRVDNDKQVRRNSDKARDYAKTGESKGGIVIIDEDAINMQGLSEQERQLRQNADRARAYSDGDSQQNAPEILVMPADPARAAADGQSMDSISRVLTNNAKAQIYAKGQKPCTSTGVAIGGIGDGGVATQDMTVIQGVNTYSTNCK